MLLKQNIWSKYVGKTQLCESYVQTSGSKLKFINAFPNKNFVF